MSVSKKFVRFLQQALSTRLWGVYFLEMCHHVYELYQPVSGAFGGSVSQDYVRVEYKAG